MDQILLEGRAGNLTILTLELVVAEKPLTWLQAMYKRLKHLIISSDTFREKNRTINNLWVKGKGKKIIKRAGKQSKGIKIL